jgi:V/A-type H+/Na+-transporting ATPase subunit E
MTDLDNVSKKVLDDAELQKEQEIGEAKKKAGEIIKEAKKRALEIHNDGKIESGKKYEEVLNIELSKIKSALNQSNLMFKINLVDDVINKARTRLISMDSEGYKKLLEKNIKALNINEGYYLIGSEEEKIDEKMVESIAKIKKLNEEPDFKKGIKIISGKAEYNISPEALIDSDLDDIRMEVAKELFGNGEGEK